MGAILPLDLSQIDEAKVGFVHQGGGLQGVACLFPMHVLVSSTAQLGVDKGQDSIQCRLFAAAPGAKQERDFLRGGPGHEIPLLIRTSFRVVEDYTPLILRRPAICSWLGITGPQGRNLASKIFFTFRTGMTRFSRQRGVLPWTKLKK